MLELTPQMIATISIFLTLTGLLGTFFYVHLSNWVRDLLALETKWQLNRNSTTEDAVRAQRECRYSMPGLHNNLPLLMAAAISIFVLLISSMGMIILVPLYGTNPLVTYLIVALGTFVFIYITFVVYLLLRGYGIGGGLRAEIDKKFPRAPVVEAVKKPEVPIAPKP